MKKLSLLIALVMVCSLIFGINTQKISSETDCDWPMFGRTPEGNRIAPDGCGQKIDRLGLKWKWSPEIGSPLTVLIINQNKMYFGSRDGKVYCCAMNPVKKLWLFDTGNQ